MPFGIPNEADASFPDLAEPDSLDFAMIAMAISGVGVVSGCAVTQRAAGANMSVDVAAGFVYNALDQTSVAAVGAQNIAIPNNATGNPRIDIIYADGFGLLYRTGGAASANPVIPVPPSMANGFIPLAVVYVPSGAVSILTANIVDKRLLVRPLDIQVFSASGTWNKPAGCTFARIFCFGGGGGGGSGRKGAANTVRCGGGGGGAAGGTWLDTPLASLPASVAVTVGAFGTGGAAVTANSTNGNAGGSGGATSFDTFLGAPGGGGGGGGTATSGGGGSSSSLNSFYSGSNGGIASASGGAGAAPSTVVQSGANGGGSGGGITSGNTASAGGPGAASTAAWKQTAAPGGVVGGAAPGAGASTPVGTPVGGGGGGGGAAALTGNAQTGGAGGRYGGGGGGGGAGVDSLGNSGAGGNGGPGVCVVISW